MKKLAVSILLCNSLLQPIAVFAETDSVDADRGTFVEQNEKLNDEQNEKLNDEQNQEDIMEETGQEANEGWVQEGDYWYYYINNEKATGWYEIEGQWYFFNEETGARLHGWLKLEEKSYYLDPSTGVMHTGWLNLEGKSYYLDPETGGMHTGWLDLEGKSYYLDPETGGMYTGWLDLKGESYYLDPSTGVMHTGWFDDQGKWLYLDVQTGAKQFGHIQVDGKWYYLDADTGARQQNGWILLENMWYYLNPQTGERHNGWFQEGSKWYYLLPETGVMQTNWSKIENKWYYFDAKSGIRKTGWLLDGQKWYYLNDDGSMRTGWVNYKFNWYYLADSGAMKFGWVLDQGKWYYLDPAADGAMDTGWLKWNNQWYFLNKNGSMKIGWHWEDSKWYYLKSSGSMATGWYEVDSKWYYSYKSGVMARDTYVDGYYLAKSGVWIPDIVNPRKVYTYDEMVSDIKLFEKHYPDLVKVEIIGKSVDGRILYAFKLGNGPKEILLNGSHHAREHMTTNLLMEMADQYIHSYVNGTTFSNYNVRTLLNKTSMWFVPMVNPDGVSLVQKGAYSAKNPSYVLMMNKNSYDFSSWKANIRGVDLNRQYPADWENIRGNTGKPSPSHFKGYKPLSEPEALALYDFTKAHEIKIATAYHSSGEILYWNFKQGSATYNRDYNIAQKYSNMTGYRLVQATTNPSGGGFTDWFIQDMKMPGFTPEISPYTYGKPVPVSYFDRIWNQNKAAGLMLANEALGL